MNKPPFPELPDYLKRDTALLDLVLRDMCRAHLENGVALPFDALPLLCERFLVYGEQLEKGGPARSGYIETEDYALAAACHAYRDQGTELPAITVRWLCSRLLAYSKALEETFTRPRGNPGRNSGRVVAALVGTGWKVEAAVAAVAARAKQDPKTVERNYYRWLKRSANSVR